MAGTRPRQGLCCFLPGLFRHPVKAPDACIYSKPVQEAAELLKSYVTSLVRCPGPLETPVCQAEREQAEPGPFKDKAFKPVLAYPAEKKECPFFQRVQSVRKPHHGG